MIELTESEESIVQEFFKDQPMGRFLELGAHTGEPRNETEPCWNLLAKGWDGYYCEPNPINCSKLIRNTWPYRNQIRIFNGAVTGISRFDALYIALDDELASCSSLHPEWMNKQPFVTAQQYPFYLNTHSIGFDQLIQYIGHDFDFISIDIEGSDDEVITSVDWNIFTNLKLICTEHPNHDSFVHLANAGFIHTGVTKNSNVFFVKKIG